MFLVKFEIIRITVEVVDHAIVKFVSILLYDPLEIFFCTSLVEKHFLFEFLCQIKMLFEYL